MRSSKKASGSVEEIPLGFGEDLKMDSMNLPVLGTIRRSQFLLILSGGFSCGILIQGGYLDSELALDPSL